jgi:hypothetical protein
MIYNGIDTETRERVYLGGEDNYEHDRAFAREAFRSPVGQRFLEIIDYDRERDLQLILTKAYELNHNPAHLTTSMFLHAIDVLTTLALAPDKWTPESGRLKRKAVEPAPVEEIPVEVPVDRNGRPLTDAQIRWAEYTRFSNSASSEQRKERIRTDAGYASFVRTNLRREMNSAPVDGGVVLNARAEAKAAPPELVKWVEEYKVTPMAVVRQLTRADCNPYGYQEYKRMFNEAVEFGLI